MPLIQDTDEPVIKVPEKKITVEEDYQSPVIDDRITPVETLLVHIEGSEWTVDYFSQVVTSDSELNPQEVNLDPVYQQYEKVVGLELKVTDPLGHDANGDTGSFTVTGRSAMYPYVIPNQGDHFYADVGDGRQGLFVVTEVERKTILKETCHEIAYGLVAYDDDATRVTDLDSKVIKTVYFKKDFLLNGKNPMLVESEVRVYDDLAKQQKLLLGHYLKTFYSFEYRTLLLSKNPSCYDHLVVDAILKVFDQRDHPLINDIEVMNVDGIAEFQSGYTVWDALLSADDTVLPMARVDAVKVRTSTFKRYPTYRGVGYSGIVEIVIPTDDVSLLAPRDPIAGDVPTHYPVDFDARYIFSNELYIDGVAKSQIEIELQKMIKGETLDTGVLSELCKACYGWHRDDLFYLAPFLLTMIKYSFRR